MTKIIASPFCVSRRIFPTLCNNLGINVAVEVGTDLGAYAAEFMGQSYQGELLCVDPYVSQDEFPWPRTADRLTAVAALLPWHGRVRFIEAEGPAAVDVLPAWLRPRIGFVYLDAQHGYEAVVRDIATWWPLVTPASSGSGILAGHDWCLDHEGVERAVVEFAEREGLDVYVTTRDYVNSWYVYKGKVGEQEYEQLA